jgi:hypothetical protein
MLKQICQRKFMEVYPDVDFISIFHKSYIWLFYYFDL